MVLLPLLASAIFIQGDDDFRRTVKATEAIGLELSAMDRFSRNPKAKIGGSRGNRLLLSELPVRSGTTPPIDVEVKSFKVLGGAKLTGAPAAQAMHAALKKEGAVKNVTVKMLKPMDPTKRTPDFFIVQVRYTYVPTGAEYVDTWSNSDGSCWEVERAAFVAKRG